MCDVYCQKVETRNHITDDWFKIIKSNKTKVELYVKDFLADFNFDAYHILKSSNRFRFVSKEEMLEMRHAGYIFLKKEIYTKEFLEGWLEFTQYGMTSDFKLKYMSRPFPPAYIMDLIKYRDEI